MNIHGDSMQFGESEGQWAEKKGDVGRKTNRIRDHWMSDCWKPELNTRIQSLGEVGKWNLGAMWHSWKMKKCSFLRVERSQRAGDCHLSCQTLATNFHFLHYYWSIFENVFNHINFGVSLYAFFIHTSKLPKRTGWVLIWKRAFRNRWVFVFLAFLVAQW